MTWGERDRTARGSARSGGAGPTRDSSDSLASVRTPSLLVSGSSPPRRSRHATMKTNSAWSIEHFGWRVDCFTAWMLTHLRYATAAVALCACGGFSSTLHVKSSAGTLFNSSSTEGQNAYESADSVYAPALLDSAAHDLSCPREAVRIQSIRGPHFVADGCSERLVYECPLRATPSSSYPSFDSECQMVLVNRFALKRGTEPRPTGPGGEASRE